jgi:hypothetical protein
MDEPGGKRGLVKPENKLLWPGAAVAAKGKTPVPPAARTKAPLAPIPKATHQTAPQRPPRPQGLPSNAMPQAQYTLEQLQKMAAARGLSVEKLLAQMVQQYLKEA